MMGGRGGQRRVTGMGGNFGPGGAAPSSMGRKSVMQGGRGGGQQPMVSFDPNRQSPGARPPSSQQPPPGMMSFGIQRSTLFQRRDGPGSPKEGGAPVRDE